MKFDLHMHSIASGDGQYTPLELINIAKENKLDVIAMTDHDTTENDNEMEKLGKQNSIRVIKGVECTSSFKGNEIHCLGYNVDPNYQYFLDLPKKIYEINIEANRERIKRLNEYYHAGIDEEAYLDLTRKNGFMNKVIIKFLAEDSLKGHQELKPFRPGGKLSDPLVPNFYHSFFGRGCPGYFEVNYPSVKQSIDNIHAAGGVAILAHPWKTFDHQEALLDEIMALGFDGLEAYSNYHSQTQNEYFEAYARKHNYIFTCGSDFHGKMKPSIKMGDTNYNKTDGDLVLQKLIDKF